MAKRLRMTARERKVALTHDKGERERVFKELCRHVSRGYSLESFGLCSTATLKALLQAFPDDFCQEALDEALREGRIYWEGIGRRQADGTCLGNSRSWQYSMINRYGWRDKVDISADVQGAVSVQVISYAQSIAPTDAHEDTAT